MIIRIYNKYGMHEISQPVMDVVKVDDKLQYEKPQILSEVKPEDSDPEND